MVIKKHIPHHFSFIIIKIYKKKTHEMKKIVTIKLIFHYQEIVVFFYFQKTKEDI